MLKLQWVKYRCKIENEVWALFVLLFYFTLVSYFTLNLYKEEFTNYMFFNYQYQLSPVILRGENPRSYCLPHIPSHSVRLYMAIRMLALGDWGFKGHLVLFYLMLELAYCNFFLANFFISFPASLVSLNTPLWTKPNYQKYRYRASQSWGKSRRYEPIID